MRFRVEGLGFSTAWLHAQDFGKEYDEIEKQVGGARRTLHPKPPKS